LKAQQIINKLKGANGTLEQVAAKYGAEAVVKSAAGVTFAANTIEGLGYDPVATGKAFGLKQGARSKPFEGQTGVVIVELLNLEKINFTGDMSGVKKQMENMRSGRAEGSVFQLIRDRADIEDNRIKFF
jgi:peptidyl-prolyl cis-trans isomerase D